MKKKRGKRKKGLEGERRGLSSWWGALPDHSSRELLRLQSLIWQRSEGNDVDLFCFSVIRIMIGEIRFVCSKYSGTRLVMVC